MKNQLKLILLLAGAMVLAAPVLRAEDPAASSVDQPGQPERGPGRRGPGALMERAVKELGLSADQEAQWKEIGKQERPAVEAIRNDSSLSKEAKRAKMMETNKTYAEQRRAVLTADQQKKFDEMRAKMREHGPRKAKDE